jgi:serine/threonine protein kinase
MVDMDAPADRFGLAGTTVAGRYQVERQVAEGGFAVVYRAQQIALDRAVALKVLKMPPGLGDAARARFEQRFATEARTIAKLQHPYIVDVYDFGVSPTPSGGVAAWMALEWLDGETLAHELDRRRGAGGRTPAEAVALLRPVIEAVAYAHRRGVVHRDIKPANIMVVESDAGPRLRMLDFGIAKIMEGDPIGDTRVGRSSGAAGFSPDYAAPEQVTFSRTGPWTDVHALGLLLAELLTDEPPFAAGADEQLFEQVMSAERPTPRRRGVDAGRLEPVIARALALSPGQRWKDAGELLEALVGGATARVKRARDRAMPMTAGAAILSVFAAVVCAVGSGGGRPRNRPTVSASTANASPWIVPMPACASPGFVASADAPVAARRPSRIPRPATPPAATLTDGQPCAVSVNSVPWSEVWIDGKNTGKHTPFVDVPIDCGNHRIDFKRPDLQIAESESIQVKPGQTFKRRYTLPGGGAD